VTSNPQNVTIRGRLSWPVFTHAEAIKRNSTSKFPKANNDDVRPSFDLLLTETHAERLITHLRDVFIPWCEAQGKAGEKSGLEPGQAKKMLKVLDEGEWDVEGILGLIKPVHEKSQELAPEAVMAVTVKGFKGRDLERKAIVKSVDQLKVDDGNTTVPSKGMIVDIDDTKLELYPGCVVAATINLFAFVSGKTPGITATAGAAIFAADADRFGGGGTEIDEDSIFMDDEDDAA
jgi:hypothetical protein